MTNKLTYIYKIEEPILDNIIKNEELSYSELFKYIEDCLIKLDKKDIIKILEKFKEPKDDKESIYNILEIFEILRENDIKITISGESKKIDNKFYITNKELDKESIKKEFKNKIGEEEAVTSLKNYYLKFSNKFPLEHKYKYTIKTKNEFISEIKSYKVLIEKIFPEVKKDILTKINQDIEYIKDLNEKMKEEKGKKSNTDIGHPYFIKEKSITPNEFTIDNDKLDYYLEFNGVNKHGQEAFKQIINTLILLKKINIPITIEFKHKDQTNLKFILSNESENISFEYSNKIFSSTFINTFFEFENIKYTCNKIKLDNTPNYTYGENNIINENLIILGNPNAGKTNFISSLKKDYTFFNLNANNIENTVEWKKNLFYYTSNNNLIIGNILKAIYKATINPNKKFIVYHDEVGLFNLDYILGMNLKSILKKEQKIDLTKFNDGIKKKEKEIQKEQNDLNKESINFLYKFNKIGDYIFELNNIDNIEYKMTTYQEQDQEIKLWIPNNLYFVFCGNYEDNIIDSLCESKGWNSNGDRFKVEHFYHIEYNIDDNIDEEEKIKTELFKQCNEDENFKFTHKELIGKINSSILVHFKGFNDFDKCKLLFSAFDKKIKDENDENKIKKYLKETLKNRIENNLMIDYNGANNLSEEIIELLNNKKKNNNE